MKAGWPEDRHDRPLLSEHGGDEPLVEGSSPVTGQAAHDSRVRHAAAAPLVAGNADRARAAWRRRDPVARWWNGGAHILHTLGSHDVLRCTEGEQQGRGIANRPRLAKTPNPRN